MFANRTTKVITVPGNDVEAEVQVTIRKLSHKNLEKAAEARQVAIGSSTRAYGVDLIKALRPDSPEMKAAESKLKQRSEDEELKAKLEARYNSYDRTVVLRSGVLNWTAEGKPEKEMDELDEAAAELLHRAILDLSLPPITAEELKAAGKED